jgi:hypothetical protein
MARPMGSTFNPIMQIARNTHVGVINWGFVAGKTKTYIPWDSWQHPYPEPYQQIWFHEIFHADGMPYSPEEVKFIRQITGVSS